MQYDRNSDQYVKADDTGGRGQAAEKGDDP